jgi:hypothetical protein
VDPDFLGDGGRRDGCWLGSENREREHGGAYSDGCHACSELCNDLLPYRARSIGFETDDVLNALPVRGLLCPATADAVHELVSDPLLTPRSMVAAAAGLFRNRGISGRYDFPSSCWIIPYGRDG